MPLPTASVGETARIAPAFHDVLSQRDGLLEMCLIGNVRQVRRATLMSRVMRHTD